MRRIHRIQVCAIWTVFTLGMSASLFAQTSQEAPSPQPQTSVALPDSPGTVQSSNSLIQPSNPSLQPANATSSQQVSPSIQLDEQRAQRPVGTAVAEAPLVSGKPAAEPSGVAVAPAKQRRVRTIVLKVGAIVGAGVAVGAVVALTAGTPSKPPGAH